MLSLSRHTPKRGTTCQRCLIIRYFILVTFAIAIFTVIIDDNMSYLGAATPMHAALAIIGVGLVGFVVKLVVWRMEEGAKLSSGHEQDAPQAACREETGQTSSH